MQEVIQIEHLAQLLPFKENERKEFSIEEEKEILDIISGIERVDCFKNVLIIKGMPVLGKDDLRWFIESLIGKFIYIPKREIIPCIDEFSVEPFLNVDFLTLSECSRVGGFHSDFWSDTNPPKYILLQCIRPDPRHPFFGRNQYIKTSDIFEAIRILFGNDFLSIFIKHKFRYKDKYNKYNCALSFFKDGLTRFHEYLVEDGFINDKVTFISAIHEIALSRCIDFVLDVGEMAIINNHQGLHRRGEATIDFNFKNDLSISSRCLQTTRFS